MDTAVLWAIIAVCFLVAFILMMAQLVKLTPIEPKHQDGNNETSLSQRIASASGQPTDTGDTEA